jgi:hypothetical protein
MAKQALSTPQFDGDDPHPEGPADPVSSAVGLEPLKGLDEESVAKIMGGYLATLPIVVAGVAQ